MCKLKIPEGWEELRADGVYLRGNEIIITGTPRDDDDNTHNCDEMGCATLSHVILRGELARFRDGRGLPEEGG